jgi:hypothetical protein
MSASNPEDWTTDDVVAWLKSMHFERDVWKKFKGIHSSSHPLLLRFISSNPCVTAQEITGEALFTLDVESLKSEVNIKKYGTRVRIVNAIHELLVHGELQLALFVMLVKGHVFPRNEAAALARQCKWVYIYGRLPSINSRSSCSF